MPSVHSAPTPRKVPADVAPIADAMPDAFRALMAADASKHSDSDLLALVADADEPTHADEPAEDVASRIHRKAFELGAMIDASLQARDDARRASRAARSSVEEIDTGDPIDDAGADSDPLARYDDDPTDHDGAEDDALEVVPCNCGALVAHACRCPKDASVAEVLL